MALKAYACPRCLTLSAEMESGDGGAHTCTPTPFARELELRVKELEEENKTTTKTAKGYIDELVKTQAILEAITGALKGEEPSDFMRSFPDVETAWWVYRLAYPTR